MQRIKHFIQTKRFFLTLLLYFLSALMPLVLMGLISYLSATRVIQEEFGQKIQENLASAAVDIDSYLISSQEVAVGFLEDSLVKQYFLPDAEATLAQKAERWRIPKILERYQNITSNYIDSIFAYFPGDTLVYTSSGAMSPQVFFEAVSRYQLYDLEFWRSIHQTGKTFLELQVDYLDNSSGANPRLVFPWVRVDKLNGRQAVIVINLSVEQIVKTLEGGSVAEGTQYLILSTNGDIIWNGTGIQQNSPEYNQLNSMTSADGQRENGLSYIWVGDQRFLIFKTVTSQFNWEIYSLVPLTAMSGIASVIPKVTFGTCLLMMLVIVALALLFSRRIYRPINSTVDTLRGQTVGELEQEAKDELELLRTGVDRLVESRLHYKQQLDQYSAEYLEYAFRLMLSGTTPVNQETLSRILENELSFREPNFIICCVCFRFRPAYYADHSDLERINIAEKLRNILALLFEENLNCYVMEPRQNIYACLVNCQNETQLPQDSPVFERMKKILSYDRQYFDIAVGIGGISYGISGIRDSYHQAVAAIPSISSSSGNEESFFQITSYKKMPVQSAFQFALDDQQKLMNIFKSGNVPQMHTMVESLLERNTRAGLSYDNYRYLYHQLMMLGVAYLSERGKALSDLELEEPARQVISEMKIPEDPVVSRKLLMDFFDEIMELCASSTPQKAEGLTLEIQEYVQRHYATNLGLEQIADQMGVSVKYISRIFKQRTGKNLTDFIGEVRIQKAKELLAGTDQRVGEVAAAVGIENRTTFLRVFKKYEGISPIEYRNLHRQEDTAGELPNNANQKQTKQSNDQ